SPHTCSNELYLVVMLQIHIHGDWKVTFNNQCGFRGASAVIKCSYDYPLLQIVTSVFWFRGEYVSGRWRLYDITGLASYRGRWEYLGENNHDCTLRINNLQDTDEGAYFFRFKTLLNSWTRLTTVVTPSTVTEGQRVSLTCESGCPSLSPFITWFRDGQPVTKSDFQARAEDAGSYYCAVSGQERTRSASVALSVQYAPKSVHLSVSPSGDIVKGFSVTFSCSCDANPAVTETGYSLYKDAHVASGQIHTISNIQPGHSGLYHCEAWNGIRRNGIGFLKSADFNLNVKSDPPGRVAEGSSVNLTCSSAANPAADSYTWYRRTGTPNSSLELVGSGQVLSLPSMEPSHTGHYLCRARNPLGEDSSAELLLEMQGGLCGFKFKCAFYPKPNRTIFIFTCISWILA
uniref:Ig-like domain-containing protein n=1 Tax=Myripristis murdjan TaxID=586833 RepID=A0A667YAP0_9TELE